MKLTAANALVASLACTLLGGCSIFTPKHVALTAPAAGNAQWASNGRAAALPSEVTDAGRALLDAGQPGFAIDTFRKALAKGEAPGPALNGLGVAYARIGRTDLAVRYFQQAMVFDPNETRYAMNLERVSAPSSIVPAMAAQMAQAPAGVPAASQAPKSRPVVSVTQMARAEIKIVTQPPLATGTARAKPITVGQSPTRVEFADRTSPASKSRVVEVAPNRSRITQIGIPASTKPTPKVRVATADPVPLKTGRAK